MKSKKPSNENPASVLDVCSPPEVLRSNLELRRRMSVLLMTLLTSVLLGISFAPFNCWFVAYFALVPWGLAMAGGVKRWSTVLIGWLGGLAFWAGMVYWLSLPTWPGYLGAIVYLSLYWLLASVLVRRAMRRGWPMWLILPVLWVGMEFARARMPLLGFPWFFLSQSQYERTTLIQICDVTGQYGVSFFVAMVNGVLLDLLHGPLFIQLRTRARLAMHIFGGAIVAVVVFVGMILYGQYRLQETSRVTSPGPKIGVVQEAFPLSLNGPFTPLQTFLESHIRRSTQLIGHNCDLVIWPETMLPPGMNKAVLETDVRKLDDAAVRSLAAREYGPDILQEYKTPELRLAMMNKIGERSLRAYRSFAVRYILQNFVEEAQLQQLTDAQVRSLAGRLLGLQRTSGVDTATLRLVLLLNLSGPPATWEKADPETVRTAVNLVLGKPAPKNLDLPALIRQVRKVVGAEITFSEDALQTQRGRSCLIETCSVLLGCPILAGGETFQRNFLPREPGDEWVYENSVLWFDAKGPSDTEYSKMFLVPFSEYVPGQRDWPAMYRWLRKLVPELMPQIRPGEALTRFDLQRGDQRWQLVTPVCFEGTIARLCRAMVAAGPKDRLILANLSNDGWFVYQPRKGPPRGTPAHMQHLVHSIFRAVENRVPVVRAVNTGISASVLSDGKIESLLELRVDEYHKRTMVAGVLECNTLVDARRSLYSLYGDVFAGVISIPAAGMAVFLVVRRRKHGKEA